ncbi:glycosyl hydrolase 53 family protein [candidate division KSB1 bacterium]|nr:glycosyl hydrolase 53 family protein [candidate division KSB1 bacterium]
MFCPPDRSLSVNKHYDARSSSKLCHRCGFVLSQAGEDGGFLFKDGGEAKSGLQIFKDHGYNWIRLRLFHTPTRLPNDLAYTIALAQAAKQYDPDGQALPVLTVFDKYTRY